MQNNIINPDKLFNLKYIDLARIDLDDRRFCFQFFHKPSDLLVKSVRRYGVIYPPVVCLRTDTYRVLDGFNRLEAARICRIKKVFCKVCEESIKECDLAWFILSLFLSAGLPHILDQAIILEKMSELVGQDCVIKNILPLLDHPPNPKVLARLLPLSKMEKTLGKALLDGIINQDMALRLMEIESVARELIGSLFIHFSFSQSKQFEILEYLIDISSRDNKSLTEILKEMGWSRIRQKPTDKNIISEGEAFRKKLRERRNPIISCLEKEWKGKIKSLHLPPSISLNPPSCFEGGTYKLSFTFKNIKTFLEKMAQLRDLGEKDAWKELFIK